jgi:glycosyltransferase involved in cell wall biosynthesis
VSAVSRFLADRATHAVGGEVAVVTPFADDAFFAATLPASRDPVVLFAGRLVRRKGAGLLPELARLVRTREPEAEVMATAFDHPLIPDPDVAPLVAELSAAPGVRLVPGLRRSSDLAALYASARVLVVPSMTEEAFGLVSVESQACGTFPVVFADGGLAETLASGRAVPVGAVDRLADEVAVALATWSSDMAIAIRVAARRFSRTASTAAFLEFCVASLTRGRRRPHRPAAAHQPADGADPAGT